ncbi:MAG: HEAT repeat domain-containing protein [Phycisphaerae bacterium]
MSVLNSRAVFIAAGALLVALVVLSLFLFGAVGSPVQQRHSDTPTEYETSDPPETREAATVAIARQGRPSVPQLRDIAQEDPEPKVRAAAIAGLGEHYDYRSVDLLADRLEAGSEFEQRRAKAALVRIIGMRFEPESGSPKERQRTAARLYRRAWRNIKGTERVREFQEKLDRKYGELP